MNDIYEQKAKKYKYKYLKLKKQYSGGGGEGGNNYTIKYATQTSVINEWKDAEQWQIKLINLQDENGNSIGKYEKNTYIYIGIIREIINITNITDRRKCLTLELPLHDETKFFKLNIKQINLVNTDKRIIENDNIIEINNIKINYDNYHDLYYIKSDIANKWDICNDDQVWIKNILPSLFQNQGKYFLFKYNNTNYISYIFENNDRRIQFSIINLSNSEEINVLYPLPILLKLHNGEQKIKDYYKEKLIKLNIIDKLKYIPELTDNNNPESTDNNNPESTDNIPESTDKKSFFTYFFGKKEIVKKEIVKKPLTEKEVTNKEIVKKPLTELELELELEKLFDKEQIITKKELEEIDEIVEKEIKKKNILKKVEKIQVRQENLKIKQNEKKERKESRQRELEKRRQKRLEDRINRINKTNNTQVSTQKYDGANTSRNVKKEKEEKKKLEKEEKEEEKKLEKEEEKKEQKLEKEEQNVEKEEKKKEEENEYISKRCNFEYQEINNICNIKEKNKRNKIFLFLILKTSMLFKNSKNNKCKQLLQNFYKNLKQKYNECKNKK
jgi:hypothetical protein